ncbi:MAG: Gldg family protein, partial [Oscillospiraceae bacterium]|nr:Gldg family protein [Oscillospiraceae bacterium]
MKKEKNEALMNEQQSNEKQNKKLKMRKKLKYGSIATAVTAIVIVVVVLINILVSMLADVRLDLTSDKVYAVSEETIDYVKNLDQDVEIAISVEQDTIKDLLGTTEMMVSETLAKYEDYSDHISVTYFDTTKDPDILAGYQEMYGGDIGSGSVIVSSGDRVKVYSLLEMFDIDSNMYSYYMYGYCTFNDIITGYKGEQMLTNAIMNVTDANVLNVGIIELANENYIFSATQGNAYAMEALSQLLD